MEALKKAELAKRKAQPDGIDAQSPAVHTRPSFPSTPARPSTIIATPPSESTLIEPKSPVTTTHDTLNTPRQSDRLSLLDDDFLDKDQSTSMPFPAAKNVGGALSLQALDTTHQSADKKADAVASAASENVERQAVQNLFQTKQNEQSAQAASSRKTFALAVGIGTLFAIIAIGVYFWIALQPKSSLLPSPALHQPPYEQPIVAAPSPSEPVAEPNIKNAVTNLTSPVPAKRESASSLRSPPQEPQPAVSKLFRVTSSPLRLDASLERGYEAFGRGDDATAKAAYEQALSGDPKNIDALSGLAAIYQRSGKVGMAADYYGKILDVDPKNTTAQAGLISLQDRLDSTEAAKRLSQALAAQPDSPPLNFSLGNLYARDKRWNEAQQVYFKAMAGDADNPDYLFNLAVSLDHLHQDKLAAQYYSQSINAANTRPASFDRTQAVERLQKLQR